MAEVKLLCGKRKLSQRSEVRLGGPLVVSLYKH